MSTQKEADYYRCFTLHMKNGEKIECKEEYSIPMDESIIEEFGRGQKRMMEYGDAHHFYIVPFDQISFIVMDSPRKKDYSFA